MLRSNDEKVGLEARGSGDRFGAGGGAEAEHLDVAADDEVSDMFADLVRIASADGVGEVKLRPECVRQADRLAHRGSRM